MTFDDSLRRRADLMDLVARGYSRGEIAEELKLSSNVVKRMLRRECRRYDVDMLGLYRLMAGRADAGGVESQP